MLLTIQMGTNMAAGNQQKHLSLCFATKALIYLSKNSTILKSIFSNTQVVQIAKFLEKSHLFNQHDSSSAVMLMPRHAIQALSITKSRTRSERTFTWIVVFSCSITSWKFNHKRINGFVIWILVTSVENQLYRISQGQWRFIILFYFMDKSLSNSLVKFFIIKQFSQCLPISSNALNILLMEITYCEYYQTKSATF